jgi:hypothetical protein
VEDLEERENYGERERRESGGRVMRDTIFNGGQKKSFPTVEVPRQCPLVLRERESSEGQQKSGSKEKMLGRSERHFISGGEGGRRTCKRRRFPGNARSSF